MKKETDTKPTFKTKLRFAPKISIKKKPMPSKIEPTSIKEASIVADLFQYLKIAKTDAGFGMRMSKTEEKVKETDTKSASIAKLKFATKIPTKKKPALSKMEPTDVKESVADLFQHLKIAKINAGFGIRMSKSDEKVKETDTKSASIPKLRLAPKICTKKKPALSKIELDYINEDADLLQRLKISKFMCQTNGSLDRTSKTDEKVKGLSLSKMDKEEDQLNFVGSMLNSMNLKTS